MRYSAEDYMVINDALQEVIDRLAVPIDKITECYRHARNARLFSILEVQARVQETMKTQEIS